MRDIRTITPWKLVWLASYPKSGNTWFRVFLTNYIQNKDTPAAINELEKSPIASCRSSFDRLYGIDSADLSFAEIDIRRPAIYDQWQMDHDILFHKVHDAYTYLADQQPLLGKPEGQAAIYFIRNPLDVSVSFAHHSAVEDIDKMIAQMNENDFSFCGKKRHFSNQLRQQLLSWSAHVISWRDAPIPKIILRYEDMINHPLETFTKAIQFLKLPDDSERIQRALEFSRFERLQEQENKNGFPEKTPRAKSFFRKGQVGSYRDTLTDAQIQKIREDHRAMMKSFGYLQE